MIRSLHKSATETFAHEHSLHNQGDPATHSSFCFVFHVCPCVRTHVARLLYWHTYLRAHVLRQTFLRVCGLLFKNQGAHHPPWYKAGIGSWSCSACSVLSTTHMWSSSCVASNSGAPHVCFYQFSPALHKKAPTSYLQVRGLSTRGKTMSQQLAARFLANWPFVD